MTHYFYNVQKKTNEKKSKTHQISIVKLINQTLTLILNLENKQKNQNKNKTINCLNEQTNKQRNNQSTNNNR